MFNLVLQSDVRDLVQALACLQEFHGYLEARGYYHTRAQVFTALMEVRPWRSRCPAPHRAPWRMVAACCH